MGKILKNGENTKKWGKSTYRVLEKRLQYRDCERKLILFVGPIAYIVDCLPYNNDDKKTQLIMH